MKLSELLKNVAVLSRSGGDPEIDDIVYDSRKARQGTAFVCLKGYTSDGHKFAASQDVVVVKSSENQAQKSAYARFSDNW